MEKARQPALPLDGDDGELPPQEEEPIWQPALRQLESAETHDSEAGASEPRTPRLLIGTCNWSDHLDFYPPGTKTTDRLAYYARHFPIVEVDSTFYAIQPARNFERWASVTPDDFAFNVKAYRGLTGHDREKEPEEKTFAAFREAIQPLRDAGKLRTVHFQYPPWFVPSSRSLDFVLAARDHFPDDVFAVEFRHTSWFDSRNRAATLDFLKKNDIVHTMVDAPQVGTGTVPRVVAVTNPSIAIVRFHGRNKEAWYKRAATTGERYRYLYSSEELAEWAPAVEAVSSRVREVHLLLNNHTSLPSQVERIRDAWRALPGYVGP